jgi:hypothetical protein
MSQKLLLPRQKAILNVFPNDIAFLIWEYHILTEKEGVWRLVRKEDRSFKLRCIFYLTLDVKMVLHWHWQKEGDLAFVISIGGNSSKKIPLHALLKDSWSSFEGSFEDFPNYEPRFREILKNFCQEMDMACIEFT